jgi:hypothetical protein
MNSPTLRACTDGFTISTFGVVPIIDSGEKSRTAS